ncbi:hypothetical protein B0H17DRAFT_1136784 [Mycena rosella]|uniref:Uncharacterized protein n=1 Tax=Mycena rosella TaxID=1033263 RepID=A0AAD7GE42_MYCRO|nr:hypothetical protein B0H17DRAFT_1136784 [Mycena rosella]
MHCRLQGDLANNETYVYSAAAGGVRTASKQSHESELFGADARDKFTGEYYLFSWYHVRRGGRQWDDTGEGALQPGEDIHNLSELSAGIEQQSVGIEQQSRRGRNLENGTLRYYYVSWKGAEKRLIVPDASTWSITAMNNRDNTRNAARKIRRKWEPAESGKFRRETN